MPLTSEEVLDILKREEQFIRHVCPKYDHEDVNIVEIPRDSFTASRLLNASPVELSLCSNVVLLGGLPALWYKEQHVRFRKLRSHIGSREMERNTKKVERYGYHLLYKKKEKVLPLHGELDGIDHFDTPNVANETVKFGNPRKKIKESHTLAAIPRFADHLKNRSTKEPPKPHDTLVERKTVPFLPNNGDKCVANRNCEETYEMENAVARDFQEVSSLFSSESSSRSRSLSISERSTKEGNKAVNGEGYNRIVCPVNSEQRGNSGKRLPRSRAVTVSHDDVADLPTILTPQSSPSENFHSAASSIKLSTGDSSSSSMELGIPVNSWHTRSSPAAKNNHILRFATQDGISLDSVTPESGLYSTLRNRKTTVVRLKSTATSKSFELMHVLDPKPKDIDSLPNKDELLKNSDSKRRMKKIKGANGRLMKIIRSGASDLSHFHENERRNVARRLKHGQIIFSERMLAMQKIAVDRKEPLMHFSEAEAIDTRVSERWKEYIVVARSTNISDKPVFIQFYKHEHIPRTLEKNFNYKLNSMDFLLDLHCKVDFYSNLDKTICIQRPDGKYSSMMMEGNDLDLSSFSPLTFYILRCRTLQTSSQLYELLRKFIGLSSIPKELIIKVPEAEISISLRFTKEVVNDLRRLEDDESESLKLSILPRGYKVFQNPLMRYINVAVMEELKRGGIHDVLKKWDKSNVLLGCCFKRYDLLQWSSGGQNALINSAVALHRSHVLEYRPYTQILRQLQIKDKTVLIEPTAIEGFLIQLTNKYGQERTSLKKFFLEPSFFFTVDNLLFYMRSHKANPVIPVEDLFQGFGRKKKVKEQNNSWRDFPNVLEHNPYPLDLSGHISWLNNNMDGSTFQKNDLLAFKSFNKRVVQILKAEGMINMCEIKDIYHELNEDTEGHKIRYQVYEKAKKAFWQSDEEYTEKINHIICILTTNGLTLKLLAPNQVTCEEWTSRLRDSLKYWKAQRNSESDKIKGLKIKNFQNLKIEEEEESNINDNTPKWLTDRGVTDPNIYNANALSALRPLLKKGILYQKPKKHSTFSKYFVVLTPGFLVFYHFFHRSTTGFAKNVLNHSHYLTLPLDRCYIYSGATTELDLLKRDHTFDEINPGSHSLPRYYSDGWRSNEDETSRCFTLWFSNKRTVHALTEQDERQAEKGGTEFNTSDTSPNNDDFKKKPSILRITTRLGVSGRSMVFMARSRQERDLWVLSIYYELERLSRANIDLL